MTGARRDDESPLAPRPPAPGKVRAVALAVAVHAAFFALIVFGVTWQSRPTPPMQAELWDKLPPVQSPAKPEPQPAKPPEPEPPRPEPKPEPPKREPPKPDPPKPEVKPEPPKPDPAIAEKKEREKREKDKREKTEKDKADRERVEKLERQKADDAKKKRDEEKRRVDEDRARREADKLREAAAAVKRTEFDKYVNAIRSRIQSKANVPDTITGNPSVQVRIRILPGGDVLDVSVSRSSGNRAYDAAIERAIRAAQPLPVPPADSELFPQFRDLNLNIVHDR